MDHPQLSTIQKNTMRYFLCCSKAGNAYCSINEGNGMVASALHVNDDCFENVY